MRGTARPRGLIRGVASLPGTPVGGIATPVGGIATPVGGIATPVGGIATPVGGIATPVGGIATPVGGINFAFAAASSCCFNCWRMISSVRMPSVSTSAGFNAMVTGPGVSAPPTVGTGTGPF